MIKKLSKSLVLSLMLPLLMTFCLFLTACDTNKHTHTFSDKWSSNETHHYHAATCEHTDEVSGRAEHTWSEGVVTVEATEEIDGEKKYACTVCGYEKTEKVGKLAHAHKFASEWTITDTHHYYAATCEHSEEKSNYEEHTYENYVCKCGKINETALYTKLYNNIPRTREDIAHNTMLTATYKDTTSVALLDFTNSNLTKEDQEEFRNSIINGVCGENEGKIVYAYRANFGGEAYKVQYKKENGDFVLRYEPTCYFQSGEKHYMFDTYNNTVKYVSEGHAQYSVLQGFNEVADKLTEAPENYNEFAEYICNSFGNGDIVFILAPEDITKSFLIENNKYKFLINFSFTIEDGEMEIEYNMEINFTEDKIESVITSIDGIAKLKQPDSEGTGYTIMNISQKEEVRIEFSTGFDESVMNEDISSFDPATIENEKTEICIFINGAIYYHSSKDFTTDFVPQVEEISGLTFYLDESRTISVTEPIKCNSYEKICVYTDVDTIPEGYAEVITLEKDEKYSRIKYMTEGEQVTIPSGMNTAYVYMDYAVEPTITKESITIIEGHKYYIEFKSEYVPA